MQNNPFGDLIPGAKPAAPMGGSLVRITPEKTPDPIEQQRLGFEARRLQISEEEAARQRAKDEKEAREAADAEAQAGELKKLATEEMRSVIRSAREAKSLSEKGWFATGFGAGTARGYGGTSAANVKGLLDTISGNVAFNRLQRMRDASKTGGALGSVSEPELDMLKSTITSLDQTQSDAQFQSKMDDIIRVYGDMLSRFDPEAAADLNPGNRLPTAEGAKADTGIEKSGVTAEGGLRFEKGLSGLPDAVANMIGEGRSAPEIVSFLNEQYQPYGAMVGTDLAGTIGGLVQRHRANPNAPVKSLGTGWESFSMLPGEQERSVMGTIAETAPGNALMHAANAATGGLPAALAGDQGAAVMQASREASPVSSMVGDLGGSLAAMYGINKMGGALTQMASRPAQLAGKALMAGGGIGGDVAYGAARGYNEGGGEGALLGALGAAGGNVLGRAVIAPAIRAGTSGIGKVTGRAVPTLSSTEARAVRNIPEEAPQMLEEAAQSGTPMMLADTSPKMRALAGSVSRRSPEAYETAENALRPRSLGQADRAIAAIEDTLGGIENPIEASEALMAGAAEKAKPLYDEFYAQPARSSPLLKSLLDRPAARDALRRAQEIAADEGVDSRKWGIDLDSEGNLSIVRDLSPQTIDYVKRALDDVIEAKGTRNAVTGRLELGESGRAVVKLKKAFVKEADKLYPQYAPARAAFAGPAAMKGALEDGKRMASSRPREIEARMKGMPEAEKEQFRLGLRIGLADKVLGKRLRNDAFEPLYGSPDNQARMAQLSPKGAQEFGKRYGMERQMSDTATEVLGGSPTARRLAADQTLESRMADAAELGFAAATGAGGRNVLERGVKGVADRFRAGFTERTARELAPILFNDDPAAGAAFLRELLARAEKADAFRRSTSRAGAGLGAGIGAALGSSAPSQ